MHKNTHAQAGEEALKALANIEIKAGGAPQLQFAGAAGARPPPPTDSDDDEGTRDTVLCLLCHCYAGSAYTLSNAYVNIRMNSQCWHAHVRTQTHTCTLVEQTEQEHRSE
jgi:hypothetical protein